jgi:hypothetical protein
MKYSLLLLLTFCSYKMGYCQTDKKVIATFILTDRITGAPIKGCYILIGRDSLNATDKDGNTRSGPLNTYSPINVMVKSCNHYRNVKYPYSVGDEDCTIRIALYPLSAKRNTGEIH